MTSTDILNLGVTVYDTNSWKGLLTISFYGEVVYYMRVPDSMVNLCSWRNGLWQYLVDGL
jgi:hypothetical protein